MEFLKYNHTKYCVENIHNIHLQHHLFEVDIQNGLNTMHHYFAPSCNYNVELMGGISELKMCFKTKGTRSS
jgi:hypothetical protein